MAAPVEVEYVVPKHHGEWTVDDVLALPTDTDSRVELVDGTLVVSPAPTRRHQRVLHRLQVGLERALPPGTELLPGINVRLGDQRLLIPDLVVVTNPDVEAIYTEARDVLLAAEIESPSTKLQDRLLKRHLYASAGVPYYLLLDPAAAPIQATLYELADGAYAPIAKSDGGLLTMSRPFAAEVPLDG